jgi:type II secretory pathway component GspD/PulD (secretin)
MIKLQEGLLSVNVRNASWQAVLQEIERYTGIEIRIRGQLSGTLTHEFEGLPLEQGLHRLLRHADHVFFYTTSTRQGTATDILTAIWLFPREGSTTTGKQLAGLLSEPVIEQPKAVVSPVKTAKAASKKKKVDPGTEQAANVDEQEMKLDAELEPEAN